MRASIAHATAVASLGVLPSFLTGTLVIQLRADLGIDAADIGWATASLYLTAAILAPIGARIARRVGTNRTLLLAPLLSLTSFLLGATAQSFAWLVAAMIVGGAANSIAQPVSNIRLAEYVRDGRLGLAFGLKQAAVPMAALIAGMAVPSLAVTVGWRWVWVAGAIAAFVTTGYGYLRRHAHPPADRGSAGRPRGRNALGRRTMLLVTSGGFLAATVGTSVGVFFVDSTVAIGLSAAAAGTLFAAFSAVAVCTRIFLGWYSDRHPGLNSYVLAACLVFIGVIGNLFFALHLGWAVVIGASLSYVLGWAWPGLLQWSVVRDNRTAIHAATGFFQAGSSLGAGVGPILFGAIVSTLSFPIGWLSASGIGLVAAILLFFGAWSVRRDP